MSEPDTHEISEFKAAAEKLNVRLLVEPTGDG
jgi:hypothetical protein